MKLPARPGGAPFRALPALLLFLPAAGCGRKSHAPRHEAVAAAPAPAPTPDNTPIEALRTPAGMVLKRDEPTPVPGKEATPVPSASTPTKIP
jgi:hypothetical protein